MSSQDPHLFYYGSDGFNDHGWGCVYRCLQSLLSRRGHPVPAIPDIMSHLSVPLQRDNPRSMWIEPKDVKTLVPERTQLVLYASDIASAQRRMMHTEWSDADVSFQDPDAWELHIRDALQNGPVIMDDGIRSYLLLQPAGDGFLIMDPHAFQYQIRWSSANWLRNSSLWMALCLLDPAQAPRTSAAPPLTVSAVSENT